MSAGRADAGERGPHRTLISHQRGRRRQQLGDVGREAARVARHLGEVEPHDPRLVLGHDHVVSVEITVRDATLPQGVDVGPQAPEESIRDLAGVEIVERCPAIGRCTRSAAFGPARPATTTVGTWTPLCAATSMRNASCSTCWTRVSAKRGADRLLMTVDQIFTSSCWCASSRPTTRMRNGPRSSSASTSVDDAGWSGANRTSYAREAELQQRVGDLLDRGPHPRRAEEEVHHAATVPPSTTPAKRSIGNAVPR